MEVIGAKLHSDGNMVATGANESSIITWIHNRGVCIERLVSIYTIIKTSPEPIITDMHVDSINLFFHFHATKRLAHHLALYQDHVSH